MSAPQEWAQRICAGVPANSIEWWYEAAWGCDDEVIDNTVDVLIRLVCRKVDEPLEEKLVRTVRGFVYSLKANA